MGTLKKGDRVIIKNSNSRYDGYEAVVFRPSFSIKVPYNMGYWVEVVYHQPFPKKEVFFIQKYLLKIP